MPKKPFVALLPEPFEVCKEAVDMAAPAARAAVAAAIKTTDSAFAEGLRARVSEAIRALENEQITLDLAQRVRRLLEECGSALAPKAVPIGSEDVHPVHINVETAPNAASLAPEPFEVHKEAEPEHEPWCGLRGCLLPCGQHLPRPAKEQALVAAIADAQHVTGCPRGPDCACTDGAVWDQSSMRWVSAEEVARG